MSEERKPVRADELAQDSGVDPLTGEPTEGFLGLYQRLENLMGQGAVASILIFIGFVIFAVWQITTL